MKSVVNKFTLGALSLTALMVQTAYADNVTIYGVMDAGIQVINNQPNGSTTSLTSGNQAGSRIGFKGSEKISDDLNVIFQLESGVDVSNGTGNASRLFDRASFVGLSSNTYGTLTAGRQDTLMMQWISRTSPFGNSDFSAKRVDPALSERSDGLFKYTNKFGDLHVGAEYSRNWDKTKNTTGIDPSNLYSLGLRYDNKTVDATLIYYVKKNTTTAGAASGNKEQRIATGLAYKLADWTLYGGYRYLKQDLAKDANKSNMFWLGASYKITPAAKISAGYYMLKGVACEDFTKATCATYTSTGDKPSMLILGGEYTLSKRTKLYSNMAYAFNKENTSVSVLGKGSSVKKGSNQFGMNLGLQHNF